MRLLSFYFVFLLMIGFSAPVFSQQAEGLPAIINFLFDDSAPGSFTGAVSLPSGVIAPEGGVVVEVSTFPVDFFFDGLFIGSTTTKVTIPAGQNSVNYSIPLFEDVEPGVKRIRFDCESGCETLDVTTNGYWNDVDGVVGLILGSTYSNFQNNTVNVLLENADTFTGNILLPEGVTTNGEEQFALRVRESALLSLDSFTVFYNPDAGLSSIPFSIGVPDNQTVVGWEVEVGCINCPVEIESERQFATTILGNPLSLNDDNAFIFPKNNDYTEILMTPALLPQ